MKIEITKNNDEIIYSVFERITSDNYMQLDETFLKEEGTFNKHVLDLSNLEYVSSAGLRAILGEEKRLKAINQHLIIRGCNSSVMDIFKVCGFDQILHFEEELPIFDTDMLSLIGEGLCAKVYRVNDDTILKCYDKRLDISMIENEKKNAREALIVGVPTAISLNVVKSKDGRLGILFEMLNAKSLKAIIQDDFEHVDAWMKKYVELVKSVHTAEGNPETLTYALDEQIEEIKRSTWLTDEERKKVDYLVSTLDRGHTCIHGDLHPGNVMVSNDELIFIDMGDFGIGHPYQDIAQVHNIMHKETSPGFGYIMTGLEKSQREVLYQSFMKYYFNNPSKEELEEIEKEVEKYVFVKHFFYINNFEDTKENNLKFVREYISNIEIK